MLAGSTAKPSQNEHNIRDINAVYGEMRTIQWHLTITKQLPLFEAAKEYHRSYSFGVIFLLSLSFHDFRLWQRISPRFKWKRLYTTDLWFSGLIEVNALCVRVRGACVVCVYCIDANLCQCDSVHHTRTRTSTHIYVYAFSELNRKWYIWVWKCIRLPSGWNFDIKPKSVQTI